MVMPQGVASDTALVSEFLAPEDTDTELMISYERGGVALNDASLGRDYQLWKCYVEDSTVKVSPVSGSPVTVIATAPGITAVSLAFDTNIQPAVAYMTEGVTKFYWFNSLTAQFQTDTYVGVTSFKLHMDDKRVYNNAFSDVIFAYIRDGMLYVRQQKDRYAVEYPIGPALGRIRRLGLNRVWRLQFEIDPEVGYGIA